MIFLCGAAANPPSRTSDKSVVPRALLCINSERGWSSYDRWHPCFAVPFVFATTFPWRVDGVSSFLPHTCYASDSTPHPLYRIPIWRLARLLLLSTDVLWRTHDWDRGHKFPRISYWHRPTGAAFQRSHSFSVLRLQTIEKVTIKQIDKFMSLIILLLSLFWH